MIIFKPNLIEYPGKSCFDQNIEKILIFINNRLVLKALEHDCAGSMKGVCDEVFIC